MNPTSWACRCFPASSPLKRKDLTKDAAGLGLDHGRRGHYIGIPLAGRNIHGNSRHVHCLVPTCFRPSGKDTNKLIAVMPGHPPSSKVTRHPWKTQPPRPSSAWDASCLNFETVSTSKAARSLSNPGGCQQLPSTLGPEQSAPLNRGRPLCVPRTWWWKVEKSSNRFWLSGLYQTGIVIQHVGFMAVHSHPRSGGPGTFGRPTFGRRNAATYPPNRLGTVFCLQSFAGVFFSRDFPSFTHTSYCVLVSSGQSCLACELPWSVGQKPIVLSQSRGPKQVFRFPFSFPVACPKWVHKNMMVDRK